MAKTLLPALSSLRFRLVFSVFFVDPCNLQSFEWVISCENNGFGTIWWNNYTLVTVPLVVDMILNSHRTRDFDP